jgi:hypothetical protein
LRLIVADARSEAVRNRIAAQVAKLNQDHERHAILWIETVSEFDADEPRKGRRSRDSGNPGLQVFEL